VGEYKQTNYTKIQISVKQYTQGNKREH